MSAGGNAQKEPAPRPEVMPPLGKRRAVILKMFEHLESANYVERLRWLVCLSRIVQQTALDADSVDSRPKRNLVRLEADIREAA